MSKTFTQTKEQLIGNAKQQMDTLFTPSAWTLRQKLALTCRILYEGGHDSGLAGQITARGAEPGTYYTQQLGLGFDEITASNLLLVNGDLDVLQGRGMPNPANRFHSWVYKARPDVNCIIHTHPTHVVALSMLEVPLHISHMDMCPLFNDCAFLQQWPGVPVGNEEGELIAQALGNKRALLLAHHGQLVAGESVEQACVLAELIERAARLQLLASAAGELRPIPERLGNEAHDWILRPTRSTMSFAYFARRVLKRHSDALA